MSQSDRIQATIPYNDFDELNEAICYKPQKKTRERVEWLRQKKDGFFSSFPQIKPSSILSYIETYQTEFFQEKVHRYLTTNQFRYVSQYQLTQKGKINQKAYQNENSQKQPYQVDFEEMFRLQKAHSQRYYGKALLCCRYCKQIGHDIKNCQTFNRKKHKIFMGAYTCYKCNQRGHIRKVHRHLAQYCPKKRYNKLNKYELSPGTEASPSLRRLIEVSPTCPPFEFQY